MARSQDTFSKREREKQRIKKQQDKEEKRKERKANKERGKPLEDMMAYVDENGNLSDVPVDPRKKQSVKQEDIQIGIPRLDQRQAEEPRKGTVTFFNDEKGYGFISEQQSRERIFVHVNNLNSPIKMNDKVTFYVERGPKGNIATNVELAK